VVAGQEVRLNEIVVRFDTKKWNSYYYK
jgi:hypothetical protein